MGTSDFGIPTLRALNEHHDLAAVVTCCDSPKGRGRQLQPSPVKVESQALGLETMDAVNMTDPDFLERLKGYNADLFYVVAFRILPEVVFSLPPDGTVNLHASLLPDYRGAAPINWAVINGDTETGLTTFYIEKTVDTGDIILNETVPIGPDETAGELAERMKITGAELSLKTVGLIEKGEARGSKQPSRGTRPAPRLFKQDGLIDWSKEAKSIHNQVRGMNPAPGAYSTWHKGPLKIHRTKIIEELSTGTPGKIIDASPQDGITIQCGKGSLRLLELQPPGKKAMDSAGFVRGYRIENGRNFSE